MRVRAVVLCMMVCASVSPAAVSAAAAPTKPPTHRVGQKRKKHARPAVKKGHPKVWTLYENKGGKLHKLAAGAPFYGRVDFGGRIVLNTKRETSGGFKYQWLREIYCGDGGLVGKVKTNGVAKPEIVLERATGWLNDEQWCVEEEALHFSEREFQGIQEFQPWSQVSVHVHNFPWTVTLETTAFEENQASISSASYFEIEVKGERASEVLPACKYFYIPTLKSQPVSPGDVADGSQRLKVSIGAQMPQENFAKACPPENAGFGFTMVGVVGEEGYPLYAGVG